MQSGVFQDKKNLFIKLFKDYYVIFRKIKTALLPRTVFCLCFS